MIGESTVSRQFVASPGFFGIGPKWSAKRAYLLTYGFVALFAAAAVVVFVLGRGNPRTAEKAGEMAIGPACEPRH
jgi:hypothetical protein